jgi:hypothetical protein
MLNLVDIFLVGYLISFFWGQYEPIFGGRSGKQGASRHMNRPGFSHTNARA